MYILTSLLSQILHKKTSFWPKKKNTKTSAKNWTRPSTNCKAIKFSAIRTTTILYEVAQVNINRSSSATTISSDYYNNIYFSYFYFL